jgi:hypothetical protein
LAVGLAIPAEGCGFWQDPPLDSAAVARPVPRERPDDRDVAALIPAGVETVIEVDMAALRRSPWTSPALINPDERLRDRKAAALGYDDFADVDRLIYAVGATGPAAPTMVVAQGRFLTTNVEAAFRDRWPSARADRWRGLTTLSSGEGALAALTPRTFCSGSLDEVRAVIDRAFGVGGGFVDEHQGALRRELLAMARFTPPSILATVVLSDRIRARVGDAFPLPPQLRLVGARLDLGETLDLQAVGVLDDAAAAAMLARRLGALLTGLGARMALGSLGLSALVNSVRVSLDGTIVRVTTTVPADRRDEVSVALRTIVSALRGHGDPKPGGSW